MARKVAAHEAAQKKAAKQKKILMILAVPMLAALVYAYMTLSSLGKQAVTVSATPAAATTPCGIDPDGRHRRTQPSRPESPRRRSTPCARSPRSAERIRSMTTARMPAPTRRAESSGNSSSTARARARDSTRRRLEVEAADPAADRRRHLDQRQEACSRGRSEVRASARPERRLALPARQGDPEDRAHRRRRHEAAVHAPRQETADAPADGGWTYTLILEPLGSAAPMTVQTTTTNTGP